VTTTQKSLLLQSRQTTGEIIGKTMAVRLRVKEVARNKGISMGKLHRQADVSYKTIKRIYSDPFYATTTITLGKLARVLGVSPGELIEEVPDDAEAEDVAH